MSLEASVKRFWSELRKPARKDNFMCYDWAPYSRHPTSRHGGAFKAGWRAAQEFLDSRRDPYRPATLRRLAWCNLGYRFVRWQHDEGRKLGDRDAAYELFKRIATGVPPPPGRLVEPPDARRLKYPVTTKQEAWLATQAEAMLLHDYRSYLRRKHRELKSWRWGGNLQCDGYEQARNNLIEAKASCKRENIRMAVGELFDCEFLGRKDFKKPNKAILLPQKPNEELVKWLRDLRIAVVWQEKPVFRDNANRRFS